MTNIPHQIPILSTDRLDQMISTALIQPQDKKRQITWPSIFNWRLPAGVVVTTTLFLLLVNLTTTNSSQPMSTENINLTATNEIYNDLNDLIILDILDGV